jgi:hypothetical protein
MVTIFLPWPVRLGPQLSLDRLAEHREGVGVAPSGLQISWFSRFFASQLL